MNAARLSLDLFSRSSSQHQSELVRIQPGVLHCQGSVLIVELPLVVLSLAVLVQTKLLHHQLLHPVTMKQDPHHVLHGGLLADQEALVLTLRHQDAVVHPHQAPLLHLQGELAVAPGITRGELSRSGVIVEDEGAGHCLADHHVHAQVEELGIPVLHLVLAKQLPD